MSLLAQPPSPGPQGPAGIPCRRGAVLLGSSPEVALHPAHTQGHYFPGISTQESPRLTGCPPGAVCSVDSAEPISWAPGSRGRGMPPRCPSADVTAACVPRQTRSHRKLRLERGEHLGKQLEFQSWFPVTPGYCSLHPQPRLEQEGKWKPVCLSAPPLGFTVA